MNEIASRCRRIADGFSGRVDAVPAEDERWAGASPCEGWTARDVVTHLVDTHHLFFGFIGHDAERPSSVDTPAEAWAATRAAMEAALDDPGIANREFVGMFGTNVWATSVDRFISGDVLVHTWDLARGLGIDDRLDPDDVRRTHKELIDLTQQAGAAMRGPDVYGPALDPPPGADEQERLLAFTGRDPRR